MLKIKYMISFFFIFVYLSVLSAWATPATNLQLAYDLSKQAISIDSDHPSDRLDRHYIQRIVVIKNSQEKQYFYFPRQTSANKFITQLDYKAIPGDHLDITLYCSQGGVTQGSIDIVKSEEEKANHE